MTADMNKTLNLRIETYPQTTLRLLLSHGTLSIPPTGSDDNLPGLEGRYFAEDLQECALAWVPWDESRS